MITQLNNREKLNKSKIRVGRGIGSGRGKTSSRGHKGQKSRSGVDTDENLDTDLKDTNEDQNDVKKNEKTQAGVN